jgi:ribosomal protein L32E
MESKFKTLGQWAKAHPSAYQSAKKRGMIPELCGKFGWRLPRENTKLHPNGYWQIKENVLADALKYTKYTDWASNNATAIMVARKNGWMEEATAHMSFTKRPVGYWTEERIFEESKNYKTPQEWKKSSSSSYSMSFNFEGLYDKCLLEMGYKRPKPVGYWTEERIFEESKNYKTPQEWKKGSSSSYSMSFKIEGLYEKCLLEMGFDRPKKIGFWQIKENVLAKAREYKTKSEWGTGKNSHGASYNSAKKNGWFEEATAHMIEIVTPAGYWTEERLMESAKKYDCYSDWIKNEDKAYKAACKKGLIDKCTAHMNLTIKPAGYWTKELLLAEARKWNTLKEWRELGEGIYRAKPLGCYEECIAHMVFDIKPSGYWNVKENVLAEALKYSSKSEWQEKSNGSKKAAKQNGWYEEATAHMIKK